MMEKLTRFTFGVNGQDEYQQAELGKIFNQAAVLGYWLLNVGVYVGLISDGLLVHHITIGTIILLIITAIYAGFINQKIRINGLHQVEAVNEEEARRLQRRINWQVLFSTITASVWAFAGIEFAKYMLLPARDNDDLHQTIVTMVVFTITYGVLTWNYRRKQVIKAWQD